MRFCCIFATVLCCYIANCDAIVRIALIRFKSSREKMIADGSWADHCQLKMAKMLQRPQFILHSWLDQQGANLEFDPDNQQYLAEVSVGNPPQTFRVIPDTGSADFWVVTNSCNSGLISSTLNCSDTKCDRHDPSCNPGCDSTIFSNVSSQHCRFNPCEGKQKFNAAISSTYKSVASPFEVRFNSGSVTGGTGTDTFRFAGIEVKQQNFGEADTLGDSFNCQQFDGILGLGYPRLSKNFETSVLGSLIDLKLLNESIFTIYLNKNLPEGQHYGGEIAIGGIDKSKFVGPIYWQQVTVQRYWQLKMDGFRVGPLTVKPAKGYRVVCDSGTPFLGGPESVISLIADAVGAVYSHAEQTYFVNCSNYNSLLPISLIFDSREFPLDPVSYVLKVGNFCILNIQTFGNNAGVQWILGNVFTKSYYTIHDFGNNQVGFAQSV